MHWSATQRQTLTGSACIKELHHVALETGGLQASDGTTMAAAGPDPYPAPGLYVVPGRPAPNNDADANFVIYGASRCTASV